VNLRHAAALVLVGWYLMAPPRGYNGSQAILSGWAIERSYDTAQACEQARATMDAEFPPLPSGKRAHYPDLCVASDDPRLKLPLEIHIPSN